MWIIYEYITWLLWFLYPLSLSDSVSTCSTITHYQNAWTPPIGISLDLTIVNHTILFYFLLLSHSGILTIMMSNQPLRRSKRIAAKARAEANTGKPNEKQSKNTIAKQGHLQLVVQPGQTANPCVLSRLEQLLKPNYQREFSSTWSVIHLHNTIRTIHQIFSWTLNSRSYRRGVVSHGDGNDEDDVTTRQNEALLEFG